MSDMELRKRRVRNDSTVQSSGTSVPGDSVYKLTSISEEEASRLGLDELDFMPTMLRAWALGAVMVFNLIVLALLLYLWLRGSLEFTNPWGYLIVQIVPPIIGTITASLWRSIAVNISRVMPYILAASPSGAILGKSILGSYFPGLSLRNALQTRNGLLVFVWILDFLSATLLSFKASLLNTYDYRSFIQVIVTPWSLYALIGVYIFMVVVLIWLIIFLQRNTHTGLRWDPVSLADHVALFRKSDFLQRFEGTDIADRDSMMERLWSDRIKLGYWRVTRPSQPERVEIWHGFAKFEKKEPVLKGKGAAKSQSKTSHQVNRVQTTSVQATCRPTEQPIETKEYSTIQVSKTRYYDIAFNLEHKAAYAWMVFTVLLIALLITALALGMADGIETSISYGWSTVVFQVIITFMTIMYTWFWQDVDTFTRTMQPFRRMYKPLPASENLLLEYSCLPPGVVTYVAFQNEHWKVAWTSIISLLQRLLPILCGASTTVVPAANDGRIIYASKPLFITMIIWLSCYFFLIPYEVFSDGVLKHLPRGYSSIADLVSWIYASKILRAEAGEPFDVPVEKPRNERWYMETRLRLKENEDGKDFHKYCFGLYESVDHPGIYCMGFDVVPNARDVPPPTKKGEDVEVGEGMVKMLAPKDLVHVLDSEKEHWTNTKEIVFRPPPQQEGGPPPGSETQAGAF
ncbi:hypothetical protein P154DRAFT_524588 [Amniculicola lignicola CBS 123094]|uniref:Uncharacterized protein n=1 Tax=Amniculicola lignicola CBS 123094 TaxID=1392246 RepID=A0A6A5W6Z7_9PLEO|nr:hypothetical protein P154DRAFT_524588 [Amniculicola lignicola CBS 123094]